MSASLHNLNKLEHGGLQAKANELARRLAEVGAETAQTLFYSAQYDGTNDVTVRSEAAPGGYRVVAEGEAVAFIEFGSGVLQPPYPSDAAITHPRGSYGQGKGANPNGWVYVGDPGTDGIQMYGRKGVPKEGVYRTKGNPPAAAMYYAVKAMRDAAPSIAKEVFYE